MGKSLPPAPMPLRERMSAWMLNRAIRLELALLTVEITVDQASAEGADRFSNHKDPKLLEVFGNILSSTAWQRFDQIRAYGHNHSEAIGEWNLRIKERKILHELIPYIISAPAQIIRPNGQSFEVK